MKQLSLIGVLALLAIGAWAQDEGPQITGFVKPTLHVAPSEDAKTLWPMSGLTAALNAEGFIGDAAWKLGAEGYANVAGLGSQYGSWTLKMVEPTDYFWSTSDNLNFGLHLKEAWFEFSVEDWDFRIGKQVFSWGLADGNNPTDILNARRLGTRVLTSLDEQKLGSWAVAGVWNLPDNLGTVSAAWLPISVGNDLPLKAFTETVFAGAPPFVPAQVIDFRELPGWSILPADSEGGIRALFYVGPLSWSASYATVLDRIPDFDITYSFAPFPSPGTGTTVYQPVRWRQHRVGLDFAWPVEGWDIRGEAVGVLTADLDGADIGKKNPFLTGVLQISRSYFDGALNASLSWSPTVVFNHRAPDSYSNAADKENVRQLNGFSRGFGQAYPFEQAVSGRLAFTFLGETLKPEALLVYNIMAKDYLSTLAVSYNLADGMNVKLGANYYGSARPENDAERDYGPFGNVNSNPGDKIYAEIKFDF